MKWFTKKITDYTINITTITTIAILVIVNIIYIIFILSMGGAE